MEYIKLINHCFSKLTVVVEKEIQVSYLRNVAMHLVIVLLTN